MWLKAVLFCPIFGGNSTLNYDRTINTIRSKEIIHDDGYYVIDF